MRIQFISSLQDVRYAARSLARAPYLSCAIIATLTVGMVAVTSLVCLVYSFYWRPLPFPDADRIVAVHQMTGTAASSDDAISIAVADAVSGAVPEFDRIAFWRRATSDAMIAGQPLQLSVLFGDSALGPLLGIRPQLGRLPSVGVARDDSLAVAISDALWRNAFGGDSDVVHLRMHVDDQELTIVGVLPARFGFPEHTDLWRALPTLRDLAADSTGTVAMLGRLRDRGTRARAAEQLTALAKRLSWQRPPASRIHLSLTHEMLDRRADQALPSPALFVGAAIFLLFIACLNVASLLSMRAAERRGEMALRACLGAPTHRLTAMLLWQVLLLAAVSVLIGTSAATALTRLMAAVILRQGAPAWLSFGLDIRIVSLSLFMLVGVTALVAFGPIGEMHRVDLIRLLRAGGDSAATRAGTVRVARRAVVVQLALCLALFTASGFFYRSYLNLSKIDFGYPAETVVATRVSFGRRYKTPEAKLRLLSAVAERLSRKGGAASIRANAVPDRLIAVPALRRTSNRSTRRDNRLIPDGDSSRAVRTPRFVPPVRFFAVDRNYADALQLRLIEGRWLRESDAATALPVIVISKRLAASLWPNSPVGHVFQSGSGGPAFTVVGVVQDVRDLQGGRRGLIAEPRADAYFSIRQVESRQPMLIYRGSGAPYSSQAATERALRATDAQLVGRSETLGGAASVRFSTRVFGVTMATFAIAAFLLVAVGTYGVVAYGVTQRKREIALRVAVGASAGQIMQLIVGDCLRFTAVGIGIGLIVSLLAVRLLSAFLFNVPTDNSSIYGLACAVIILLALFTSWLSVRRLAKLDPMLALKAD